MEEAEGSDGKSLQEEEDSDEDEDVASSGSSSVAHFTLAGSPGRLGQEKLRHGAQAANELPDETDDEATDDTVVATVALLQDGDGVVRERAVVRLGRFGRRKRPQSQTPLLASLSDGCWQVRRAALEAMALVGTPGDRTALEACAVTQGDGIWQVRRELVRSLQALGKHTDLAVKVTGELVKDWRPEVALEAISALVRQVSHHQRVGAARAIGAGVQHRNPGVRDAAIAALCKLAGIGSASASLRLDVAKAASAASVTALDHMDDEIRESGVRSLDALRTAGANAAFEWLKTHSPPRDAVHRRVIALAELAEGYSPPPVPAEAAKLSPAEAASGALEARLEAAASYGNEGDAIRLTVELFEHADASVRDDAAMTLPRVVNSGINQAFELTKTHLMSPFAEVRETAVKATAQLAEPGDQALRDVLRPFLADDSAAVRQAAMEGLVRVCGQPSEVAAQCVALVAGALPSLPSASLRRAHFHALLAVVEEACRQHAMGFCCDVSGQASPNERDGVLWMERNAATQAALEAASVAAAVCLEDSDVEIRGLALETLASLRRKGAKRVITAVALRLTSFFLAVRQAAVKGLTIVARVGDTFAISAAAVFVEHRDWEARQSALDALAYLVDEPQLLSTVASLAALAHKRDEASWARNAPAIQGVLERFCQSAGEAGGREGRQRYRRRRTDRHLQGV